MKRLPNDFVDIIAANTDPSSGQDIASVATKKLDKVDFVVDIRSQRDVDRYIKELVVVLDCNQTSLSDIVDTLLREMTFDLNVKAITMIDDVKQVLFVDEHSEFT